MNSLAEKELQRLRKLPENRVCPNCSRKDTAFGFSAVCVKFQTFVCGECKAAHQAFSHRCKSVSMSTWTMEEVAQLDERSGGGNRLAEERWTSRAPASERPTSNSPIDDIKRFVDRAYNQRAWEGPIRSQGQEAAATVASAPQDVGPQSAQPKLVAPKPAAPRPTRVAAPPAPAPAADLLDLLDDSPAATSVAPVPAPAPPPGAKFDGVADQLLSFSPATSTSTASGAALGDLSFDPFASPTAASVSSCGDQSQSSFAFIPPMPGAQQPDTTAPAASGPSSFSFINAASNAQLANPMSSVQPVLQPQQQQQPQQQPQHQASNVSNLWAGGCAQQTHTAPQVQPTSSSFGFINAASTSFGFINAASPGCGPVGSPEYQMPATQMGSFSPVGHTWPAQTSQVCEMPYTMQTSGMAMMGSPSPVKAAPAASLSSSLRDMTCSFDPFAPMGDSFAPQLCA